MSLAETKNDQSGEIKGNKRNGSKDQKNTLYKIEMFNVLFKGKLSSQFNFIFMKPVPYSPSLLSIALIRLLR